MKKNLVLPLVLFLFSLSSTAQSFETAGDYMEYISKANQALTEKYLYYLSGMSHGKNAKKIEKRRQDLLQSISDTRSSIAGMPPFKGDRTLKDTTVAYLKMLNSVFNEDYGKIVNMEEIAEQSYDLMEAYMLAKEKANEKLNEASQRQRETQEKFAAKNNVRLIQSESELDAKMKLAAEVMKDYNDVYLVFFKSYKQEAYLLEAVNQKNIVSIEQSISSLKKFSEEGLDKLKGMKGYNNDPILITACTNMMNFYKMEADKSSAMTDFYMKEEDFAKLKKQFDAKPASKRTQQDVDQMNKSVNDINAAGNNFNATNADLNKQRTAAQSDWDKAVKKYMDTYMPVQQK